MIQTAWCCLSFQMFRLWEFIYDFVTPQKRDMSEGYWLFTLKMAVQSLGDRDSTLGSKTIGAQKYTPFSQNSMIC